MTSGGAGGSPRTGVERPPARAARYSGMRWQMTSGGAGGSPRTGVGRPQARAGRHSGMR